MKGLHVILLYVVFLTILVSSLLPSRADGGWLFGPDTTEECRDDYIGDGKTDLAVRLIVKACNVMFSGEGREEWADCILEHVGDTGSDTAIKLMAMSCSNKANNKASKRDKCLLAKLPGSVAEQAAKLIAQSCSN